MITCKIPFSFQEEIKYSLDILLEEFLGLEINYNIVPNASDIEIQADQMKTLIIKNQFFKNHTETIGYLDSKNIPSDIQYWTDSTLNIHHLPILFGDPKLEDKPNSFLLYADIISSSFFMLSRWEENVNNVFDIHHRMPADASLAVKYNYIHRPIVNEYTDLLWTILVKAGYSGTRKEYKYTPVISHDIDQPYQWPNWYTNIKHIAGDLIKRSDFAAAKKNLISLYQTLIRKQKDPFDNHSDLFHLAEQYGQKVYFNFIVSHQSRFDQSLSISDPRFQTLINQCEDRGHTIGFHPGYNSYNNAAAFQSELTLLQKMVKQKINCGRQHYLRFSIPHTWSLWDQADMSWESSMGYPEQPGFRCGTCYSYSVFNCLTKKKLSLKERPLILMDASLIFYLQSIDWTYLEDLKNQCKKHRGEWMTLLHNDLVHHPLLNNFEELIYG